MKSILFIIGMVCAGSLFWQWQTEEPVWLPLIFSQRTPTTPVAVGTPTLIGTTQPAPTVTSSPTAAQPSLPLRAAFYYPWFPQAWSQSGLDPFTRYRPKAGLYDSSDPAVIQQHIDAMQYGNIDVGIASWWGQGHHTDQRIPNLLAATDGSAFRWALYYEPEAQGDPTVAELQDDLSYLLTRYGNHPGYLRLDDRFVLFIFADTADGEDGCEMVARWREANVASPNAINAYLVFKVFHGFRECVEQPDGWHQYAPAVAESHQKGYSYSISPGFWRADVNEPRLVRDLTRWHASIRAMIAANEPWQLITTFNEWGEGTAVEPAEEWQSESGFGPYLDALHRNGEDPNVVTPTPTPTSVSNGTIPPIESTKIVLTPVADAYVNAAKPTTTYGRADLLRADKSPDLHTYLRFEIPPTTQSILRASVRLYTQAGSILGYEIRDVSNGVWDELTITYENAPTVGDVIDSSGAFVAQSWTTVDVTRLIHGDQTVTFAILNLNDTATSYSSREAGALSPRLELDLVTDPPPPPENGVVALAVGDIASCRSDGDEATAALLDEISGPIMTLGDTVYDSGTTAEFAECFDPSWGRHKARIRPAVGNHEYGTPGAAPYYAYFGAAAGEPDEGYYSYDLGDWHVVVLNTNCSKAGGCYQGSQQADWLRADLAQNATHCTLAYFHHPRWSSGRYQINDHFLALLEILYDQGVELILSGHAHSYERFAPQDPAGNLDSERGFVQFVVGTGGKNHRPIDVNILPNSKVRHDTTFGVLKLTLYTDRYHWEFVPVQGGTFTDSGWGNCH